MLQIQMQVQVLPVATAIILVCRYTVRYHGEWFDIACVQMVHTWENRMWRRSKENCSSDAMSVYVCESNKMVLENTISREFIIEWVINGATASLSLLNTSGSVAMDRNQWFSTCMHDIVCFYSVLLILGMHNPTGWTRMTRQLVQQPTIFAESMCKSMVPVVNEWHRHHSCFWM